MPGNEFAFLCPLLKLGRAERQLPPWGSLHAPIHPVSPPRLLGLRRRCWPRWTDQCGPRASGDSPLRASSAARSASAPRMSPSVPRLWEASLPCPTAQMQFRLFSFALIILNCMDYSHCQGNRWRRSKRGGSYSAGVRGARGRVAGLTPGVLRLRGAGLCPAHRSCTTRSSLSGRGALQNALSVLSRRDEGQRDARNAGESGVRLTLRAKWCGPYPRSLRRFYSWTLLSPISYLAPSFLVLLSWSFFLVS